MTLCIVTGQQCVCQPDEATWCPHYKPDWYAKCLMEAIVELRAKLPCDADTIDLMIDACVVIESLLYPDWADKLCDPVEVNSRLLVWIDQFAMDAPMTNKEREAESVQVKKKLDERLTELKNRHAKIAQSLPPSDPAPSDWEHPNWAEYHKVHCWRNHVGEEVIAMWESFTPAQKKALAAYAEELASREEWE